MMPKRFAFACFLYDALNSVFLFGYSLGLISFLRGGRKSIEGKNISHHLSARKGKEEPSMNSREKYLQNTNNISNKSK